MYKEIICIQAHYYPHTFNATYRDVEVFNTLFLILSSIFYYVLLLSCIYMYNNDLKPELLLTKALLTQQIITFIYMYLASVTVRELHM